MKGNKVMNITTISKILEVHPEIPKEVKDGIMRQASLAFLRIDEKSEDFASLVVLMHTHLCTGNHSDFTPATDKDCDFYRFDKIDESEAYKKFTKLTEDILLKHQLDIDSLETKLSQASNIARVLLEDECIKYLSGKILAAIKSKEEEK